MPRKLRPTINYPFLRILLNILRLLAFAPLLSAFEVHKMSHMAGIAVAVASIPWMLAFLTLSEIGRVVLNLDMKTNEVPS